MADNTKRSNVIPLHAVIPKMPIIAGIRPEKRSRGLDSLHCCWHVLYQFCGLSAEIIVHAQNETEARVKAVDQLRARGLKVASLNVVPQLSECFIVRDDNGQALRDVYFDDGPHRRGAALRENSLG